MDGAREVAWVVTRAGCGRGQVAGDFSALVSEVEAAWANLFPRRLGYCTRTQMISDDVVRLEVRRGDFEGRVELCCDWERRDAGRIRAVATARSHRMIAAEAAGQRVIRRARGIATFIGALMCGGFCWLAAGAPMPVVAGLMLSIITACLLVGGGNIGSRIGEGVAAWRMLRAEQAVSADIGVQADIKRWNSLNRQLRGHRRALARGLGADPFRRAALGA
jgi:hypothetical protein